MISFPLGDVAFTPGDEPTGLYTPASPPTASWISCFLAVKGRRYYCCTCATDFWRIHPPPVVAITPPLTVLSYQARATLLYYVVFSGTPLACPAPAATERPRCRRKRRLLWTSLYRFCITRWCDYAILSASISLASPRRQARRNRRSSSPRRTWLKSPILL